MDIYTGNGSKLIRVVDTEIQELPAGWGSVAITYLILDNGDKVPESGSEVIQNGRKKYLLMQKESV
ncbi:MAG: hypothetical protein GTN76_01645 [Candidatus Aenigmarchaeota archaeon]|nr:hypothetical protein [Candidatus Aenigmarchaeota archaeon]